jgi:uncharacterized protein (DUF1015 family)
MNLFTKLKEDKSFKINKLKKSKNLPEKKSKNDWLLSDDQFYSILHSSNLEDKVENSKINELLLREEEVIE